MLSYKAEGAGGIVLKVNPRNTSRIHKYGELDRDYNASLNILERGLSRQRLPLDCRDRTSTGRNTSKLYR
jgi:putative transposase